MTGVGPDSFRPTYTSAELGISTNNLPAEAKTSTVSALKGMVDTTSKDDKLTLDEIMQLKIATQMAIGDPQLPAQDKAKLQAFYNSLTDAATHIFHNMAQQISKQTPEHLKAVNDYMMVNCVVDLFKNTNELSKLYTQMMRAESQLGQKLGMVFIQMAKDVYSATIASGELEAKNLIADASLKSLEAASYGLKAGITGISHLGKKLSEQGALRTARQENYAKKQEIEQHKADKLNESNRPVTLSGNQKAKFDQDNSALPEGQKMTPKEWVDKKYDKYKETQGPSALTKEQWAANKNGEITLGPKAETKLTLQKAIGEEPLTFDQETAVKNAVAQKWNDRSGIAGNAIDGTIAAFHAGTDIYKAANILQKAQIDATRGFSQSMMDMIKETMHKLDEDKGSISQIMNKLWDAVAAQQRVSSEQWK